MNPSSFSFLNAFERKGLSSAWGSPSISLWSKFPFVELPVDIFHGEPSEPPDPISPWNPSPIIQQIWWWMRINTSNPMIFTWWYSTRVSSLVVVNASTKIAKTIHQISFCIPMISLLYPPWFPSSSCWNLLVGYYSCYLNRPIFSISTKFSLFATFNSPIFGEFPQVLASPWWSPQIRFAQRHHLGDIAPGSWLTSGDVRPASLGRCAGLWPGEFMFFGEVSYI